MEAATLPVIFAPNKRTFVKVAPGPTELKSAEFYTAVLLLTGVATFEAFKYCAQRMPTMLPRNNSPCSSAMSGLSASPSVETNMSIGCSEAHNLTCSVSSGRTASVSMGTNASEHRTKSLQRQAL